jgi:hypothetical protein
MMQGARNASFGDAAGCAPLSHNRTDGGEVGPVARSLDVLAFFSGAAVVRASRLYAPRLDQRDRARRDAETRGGNPQTQGREGAPVTRGLIALRGGSGGRVRFRFLG